MLTDFYLAFAAASFTLLGLWMIVVQTRHAEWRGHPAHARRAYAISLQFSLPGIMSLVTLADPDSSLVWRWSFGLVAIGGVIALVALDGRKRTVGGTALYA